MLLATLVAAAGHEIFIKAWEVVDFAFPVAPEWLHVSALSDTAVTLMWSYHPSAHQPPIGFYNVYQDGSLLGTAPCDLVGQPTQPYEITGLSAATSAKFEVEAVYDETNLSCPSSSCGGEKLLGAKRRASNALILFVTRLCVERSDEH